MHIFVAGLNHQTASVELRERLSLSEEGLTDVLAHLRDTRTVLECVVLSTCNRTEMYAIVPSLRAAEDFFVRYFAQLGNLTVEQTRPHLYFYHGEVAVHHAMRVACGLDSLVIGETQILGQVRTAYQIALEAGNSGALLNQMFKLVLQVGKRAQSETTIGQNPVSISYAAVQLAKKLFGDLKRCKALVLGAGEMSDLTAQHLYSNGIGQLFISNRTLEKAEQVANKYGGQAISFASMREKIGQFDIIVSSTRAQHFILSRADFCHVQEDRRAKPLMIIDIAMPRDVEPAVAQFKHVYLYDIDDLHGVVDANLQERQRQATEVNHMIDEALHDFSKWLAEQEVVPLIAAIRAKGIRVQTEVMESLQRKLPNLSDRDVKLIQKHTMSIVNQLLRDPIQNMKEMAINSGGRQDTQLFADLFGIAEEERVQHDLPAVPISAHKTLSGTEVLSAFARKWRSTLSTAEEDGAIQDQSSFHPVLR